MVGVMVGDRVGVGDGVSRGNERFRGDGRFGGRNRVAGDEGVGRRGGVGGWLVTFGLSHLLGDRLDSVDGLGLRLRSALVDGRWRWRGIEGNIDRVADASGESGRVRRQRRVGG